MERGRWNTNHLPPPSTEYIDELPQESVSYGVIPCGLSRAPILCDLKYAFSFHCNPNLGDVYCVIKDQVRRVSPPTITMCLGKSL